MEEVYPQRETVPLCDEEGRRNTTTPTTRERSGVDGVIRKLSRKFVPMCFLVTFLNHLDRTNLGLGAREFCSDLGLSTFSYGTGVGLFFISYATFQVPSNAILERVGAPKWLGALMVFWGLVASSTAFVTSETQFYFVRVLLGIAEAGTFPGIWYYLSLFFPPQYRTLPLSIVELGILVSQIFGSPFGAALLSLDNVWGWRGWQWLFFLEGLPSILLGIWFFSNFPATPQDASFLSSEERGLLVEEFEASSSETEKGGQGIRGKFGGLARNWRLWVATLAKFLRNMTSDVTLFWTPLWIDAMLAGDGLSVTGEKHSSCGSSTSSGRHDSHVALLTTIPFTCAGVTALLVGWNSERTQERRYHIGIAYITASVVFALLPSISKLSLIGGFIALIVTLSGANGAGGPLISLTASYLTPSTRAIGLACLNSIGHLGGYVGSTMTGKLVDSTGQYFPSVIILAALLCVSGLLVIFVLDEEADVHKEAKRKRRKVHGEVQPLINRAVHLVVPGRAVAGKHAA